MLACTQRELSVAEQSGSGQPEPAVSVTQSAVTLSDRIAACNADPRVTTGLVSVDVCVGADLFFRETFGGNGRTCGTCHPAEHNFVIDPKFISTQPKNDPLFIAENDPNLAGLEIPKQMRGRSLIVENVDGFAPLIFRHFVLRAVPHTLSLGTSVTTPAGGVTPPADRTGWSGDGAPGAGALRDFLNGAIVQHYPKTLNRVAGVDFRLAAAGELDRVDRFMREVGRTNELNLTAIVMADPGAEAGRQAFLTVGCNGCHGNAGANASFGGGGNRNFNTGVETARSLTLIGIPVDGGFGATQDSPLGGFGDDTFNTPPLIEAADTGPFFHTDVTISGASAHNGTPAATIEQAIAFYDSPAFNNSPAGQAVPINLTATQIDNIGRFLRGLNASFNMQLAVRRLNAASTLLQAFGNTQLAIQRKLIDLAVVEAHDAIAVLQGQSDLNQPVLDSLQRLLEHIGIAQAANTPEERSSGLDGALEELDFGLARVGTNITFNIGAGTLMF
jgi:cytochrome c peroxidase